MIRVLAGKYKGTKLSLANAPNMRPTLSRVKKSIFDSLGNIEGLSVLDLFSGIGTLAVESISRGASKVVCIEKDRKVFFSLMKNIQKICVDENINAYKMDVESFIKNNFLNMKFDIIFADPPYNHKNYEDLFQASKEHLNPQGILCFEMRKKNIVLENVKIKVIGKTQVVYWRSEWKEE